MSLILCRKQTVFGSAVFKRGKGRGVRGGGGPLGPVQGCGTSADAASHTAVCQREVQIRNVNK